MVVSCLLSVIIIICGHYNGVVKSKNIRTTEDTHTNINTLKHAHHHIKEWGFIELIFFFALIIVQFIMVIF